MRGAPVGPALGSCGAAQEPQELCLVQAVAAHHRAIQKQHRDVQPVAALQGRVGIHVHQRHGRQPHPAPEAPELPEHGLAQLALVPLHEGEACGCTHGWPWTAAGARVAFTWVAMNCTVSGGTSPTAVTRCPSTTVEKAELLRLLGSPARP